MNLQSHEMKLSVLLHLFILSIIASCCERSRVGACNPYQSRQSFSGNFEQSEAGVIGGAERRDNGQHRQRTGARRTSLRAALTLNQRLPDVSELSSIASGPAIAPVRRTDKDFSSLLNSNCNADIVFDIDPSYAPFTSNSSRATPCAYASRICYDRLNTLAIYVMNQYPNVKLRVTRAWVESPPSSTVSSSASTQRVSMIGDESPTSAASSLHYEGRAVDITTSDRDPQKLGTLARLAKDAGFDYVEYTNRAYVHASVKSENDKSLEHFFACFDGNSTVKNERGEVMRMRDVREGDRVATFDWSSRAEVLTTVVGFLHRDTNLTAKFFRFTLDDGTELTVTAYHVVFTSSGETRFAKQLSVGDQLLVHSVPRTVTKVTMVRSTGIFAPLTESGTVLVNGVLVSSYADSTAQRLVHALFAPLRVYFDLRRAFDSSYLQRGASVDVKVYVDLLKTAFSSFV